MEIMEKYKVRDNGNFLRTNTRKADVVCWMWKSREAHCLDPGPLDKSPGNVLHLTSMCFTSPMCFTPPERMQDWWQPTVLRDLSLLAAQ
jgi:hypothetical protein